MKKVDNNSVLVATLYSTCVIFLLHPGRFSVLHYTTPTMLEVETYKLKYTGIGESFASGTKYFQHQKSIFYNGTEIENKLALNLVKLELINFQFSISWWLQM